MHGATGIRLLARGATHVVNAPQNVLNVQFPHLTVLKSSAMSDFLGRPVYRKDVKV